MGLNLGLAWQQTEIHVPFSRRQACLISVSACTGRQVSQKKAKVAVVESLRAGACGAEFPGLATPRRRLPHLARGPHIIGSCDMRVKGAMVLVMPLLPQFLEQRTG